MNPLHLKGGYYSTEEMRQLGEENLRKELKRMNNIQDTLAERAKTHGSFVDNGNIMQLLKGIMRNYGKNWCDIPNEQKEALEMIQHKIGRILSGNNNEPDHWKDIAGYATLVENILVHGSSHISPPSIQPPIRKEDLTITKEIYESPANPKINSFSLTKESP